jgi:hypothetical protein
MTTKSWQAALAELGAIDACIDAAIAQGDVRYATQVAFDGVLAALSQITLGPCACEDGLLGVHGLYVEMTPMPLTASQDGTVTENGTYVNLAYRRWDLPQCEADQLLSQLTDQWHCDAGTSWLVDAG